MQCLGKVYLLQVTKTPKLGSSFCSTCGRAMAQFWTWEDFAKEMDHLQKLSSIRPDSPCVAAMCQNFCAKLAAVGHSQAFGRGLLGCNIQSFSSPHQ